MFSLTAIKGYSRKLVLCRWQKSKQNTTSSQLLARSLLQTDQPRRTSPASPLTGPVYRGASPPLSSPPLHRHLAFRSMATSQLYGSGLVAKRSMRSLEGLRPSPLWSRISSSDSVDLKSTCFGVPAFRVFNISDRMLSVSMCLNGTSAGSSVEANPAIRSAEGTKPDPVYGPFKSNPTEESVDRKMGMDMQIQNEGIIPTKRSANYMIFASASLLVDLEEWKIQLTIYTGSSRTLLALPTLSYTFIINLPSEDGGQLSHIKDWQRMGAFSAAFLWKLIQAYTLSKTLFPTGFYIFSSVDLRRESTTEEVGSSSAVISHENLYMKKTLFEHGKDSRHQRLRSKEW
ncbi:hypothetical protein OPV22_032088 [Ensete ventricosum]|uniref:Uncharacterized protein n=1 Tax=Ensete ventricosum TaxID=4639 RepID=A0AAV8PVM7_ENSVE|nr:hypothetical protein OPV22_032088 [Ensete ventricosum]